MTPRRATKKQAAAAPPVDDGVELANLDAQLPPGYTTMTPTDERRERELEEIISEIGSDGRIKVWSIIDGKSTYGGDMSAEGFTLDALLDAYGGGDKSLVIMQGKTKVDTFRVSLDPTIPAKNPRTPKPAAMNGAASPPITEFATVLATMAQSQMQNAQMMTTMMTGMMGALTSVLAASKPTTDPMDTALRVAEMLKSNNGGGNVAEAMAMFREGLNLAERFGKDDDDGMMTVVGKGMDTLAVLVDGIVTSQKAKALAAASPVATVPPPIPNDPNAGALHRHESTTPPESENLNNGQTPVSVRPWVDAARPNIGALLNASKFLPAAAAASAIDNMLSDDQFNDLIDDIQDQTDGGFGARLRAYFPADVNDGINAEWIGQVIHILLTEYVGEDEPENG